MKDKRRDLGFFGFVLDAIERGCVAPLDYSKEVVEREDAVGTAIDSAISKLTK